MSLFDTPTALAAHRAHLDALRPADLPDECQASQRTLAAVAALLARLDLLEGTVKLAADVRAAQATYFRKQTGLVECKTLERRLDFLLKEVTGT